MVQAFEMQTLMTMIAVGGGAFCINMFLGALSFECVEAINFPLFCFSIFSGSHQQNQARNFAVERLQMVYKASLMHTTIVLCQKICKDSRVPAR
jgi:hypothetical protein